MSNRSWVTLATNDSYGLGALVLAHSLRRAGSVYPAVVLITPSVTEAMRERLRAVFSEVVTVDVLDSRDAAHLALLQRPELGITFTKIHCWNLTQYEKCVFLDADILVVQNCDELFEREELSAAPDVGWPDCFNSGVFVFKPSAETFASLVKFAQERGSFDGGDQGLLNSFFSDWAHGDINKHLPFLYNVTSAAFYSYLPALKHYGQNLKIIHFIGAAKPWLQQFNWESRQVDAPEHLREFLQLWWDLFVAQVHAQLDVSMVEVEVQHHEIVDDPPELPPQDVNRYLHYQPVLDPESEFPWHRPDAQIQEEINLSQIDMSDFHDPWDIYRGHIPPITDDTTSHQSDLRVDRQEDIRKYAWEYQAQEYTRENVLQSQQENWNRPVQEQGLHYDNQQYHTGYYTATIYNHGQNRTDISEDHRHNCHHTLGQNQGDEHSTYNYEPEHWRQGQLYSEYPQHLITDNTDNQRSHEQYAQTITTNHQTYSNQTQFTNNFRDGPSGPDHHLQSKDCLHDISTSLQNHISEPAINDIDQKYEKIDKRAKCIEVRHVHVEQDRHDDMMINGDISDSESEIENVRPRHPYDGYYLRHRVTIDSRGHKICSHEIPPPPSPSTSESPTPQDYYSAEDSQSDNEEQVSLKTFSTSDQSGVAGNFARVALGGGNEAIDDLTRRQGWEAGNIDYMGVDAFENIWAKISQTLSQPRSSPPKQSSPREPTPPASQPPAISAKPVTEEIEVAKEALPVEAPVPTKEPAATDAVKAILSEVPAPVEEVIAAKSVAATDTPAPSETPAVVSAPVESATPSQVIVPDVVSDVAKAAEVAPAPTENSPAAELKVDSKPLVEQIPAPVKVAVAEAAVGAEATAPIEATAQVQVPTSTDAIPSVETTDPVNVTAPVETAAPVEVAASEEAAALLEIPESEVPIPLEVVAPVEVAAPLEIPESEVPVPLEAAAPVEVAAPIEVSESEVPVPVASIDQCLVSKKAETDVVKTETPEIKSTPSKKTAETPKSEETVKVTSVSPALAEAAGSPAIPEATPEKVSADVSTDSPPLANTPSKEETPAVPAAKSAERRKPAGKLQLGPPAAPDPLPTPDSELEDAATLAQSIIASELRTPTVTAPTPVVSSPPAAPEQTRLAVDEPKVPTPPVTVALSQIGVKPKGKSSTAAQIESSVTEKAEPASKPEVTPASATATATSAAPATPADAPAPKKKVVKKVVKKDGAGGADAPVPPPRKKEKKPKEK